MRLSTALISLTLATALASPAFAAGTMQMSGHGEIMAKPDTAYVTSGVTSQAATAKDALAANTADMTALIGVLKDAGVAEEDIQTSGFAVNPNYIYSDQRDANGYQLPPKISGYTVTNSVTVHVRDLSILGTMLDKEVSVGANTINGINFAVEDPSALYDQARKAALPTPRARPTSTPTPPASVSGPSKTSPRTRATPSRRSPTSTRPPPLPPIARPPSRSKPAS